MTSHTNIENAFEIQILKSQLSCQLRSMEKKKCPGKSSGENDKAKHMWH